MVSTSISCCAMRNALIITPSGRTVPLHQPAPAPVPAPSADLVAVGRRAAGPVKRAKDRRRNRRVRDDSLRGLMVDLKG